MGRGIRTAASLQHSSEGGGGEGVDYPTCPAAVDKGRAGRLLAANRGAMGLNGSAAGNVANGGSIPVALTLQQCVGVDLCRANAEERYMSE